jgi:hypothetical protein
VVVVGDVVSVVRGGRFGLEVATVSLVVWRARHFSARVIFSGP